MGLSSFINKVFQDDWSFYTEKMLSADDAGDNSVVIFIMHRIDSLDIKFSGEVYKKVFKDKRSLLPMKEWALSGICRIIRERTEDSLENVYICRDLESWLAYGLAQGEIPPRLELIRTIKWLNYPQAASYFEIRYLFSPIQ